MVHVQAVRTNRHRQSGRLDDGLDGVSHIHDLDGPIRHRKCRYILTMDQSDTGSAGIFSRWTNRTQEAQVCSARRAQVGGATPVW